MGGDCVWWSQLILDGGHVPEPVVEVVVVLHPDTLVLTLKKILCANLLVLLCNELYIQYTLKKKLCANLLVLLCNELYMYTVYTKLKRT